MANLCKHEKGALPTNGDGSNLSVDIQHAIAVNVHQVVPSALFIITEEVQRLDILSEGTPEHMIHSNPQNDTCIARSIPNSIFHSISILCSSAKSRLNTSGGNSLSFSFHCNSLMD